MLLKKAVLTSLAVVIGGTAVFAATPLGRDLIFQVMPLAWTGEATRLAAELRIGPGSVVADIGAGSGDLIVELSRLVTAEGRAYATEMTTEKLQRINERAKAAGMSVTVISA